MDRKRPSLSVWLQSTVPVLAFALCLSTHACLVESTCYNDADCPAGKRCDTASGRCEDICLQDTDCAEGQYCNPATGECREAACFGDDDCASDERCSDHRCVPRDTISCPDDMVAIDNRYCMDIYEASRPDATATSRGSDASRATSREGVLPWYSPSLGKEEARAACSAAGKRLCTLDEWVFSCRGTENTEYCYGDDYDPLVCNSIDTFCYCDPGSPCEDADPCPYPHCRDTCGANLHPTPTGAFPDCLNSWGVYDICGNAWELADSDDDLLHFRGGAFNCIDSESLHRCDHDGTWGPSARGFRCCKDPDPP